MYKKITITTLVILLASCAPKPTSPPPKKEAVKGSDGYLGEKGIKEFEKDPAVVLRETNKVKCQDARMDMVDAEAKGDVGEVRLVKARLQKYCVPDE